MWPEVQQRAAVVGLFLALVVADHRGLEGAGALDRLGLRVAVAADHALAVPLAPGEERGVADQAGLGDLGVSGAQFARRQRAQRAGVGQHHARLVERADQVLAALRVDPGLAADRGIHLRQQRGRDLHERQAAQGRRRGEPRQIADHAAAQRDDRGAPLDPRLQQLVDDVERRCPCSCDASPPVTTIELARRSPSRARPSSRVCRCRPATSASVTTTARFCGSLGASSAPARASRLSPITTS